MKLADCLLAFPKDLGEAILIKILLGVIPLSALVLLIWGPLLVIGLIATTNQPNNLISYKAAII